MISWFIKFVSSWFAKPKIVVTDMIMHPSHYTSHPSGLECWDINEAFEGNVAAAIKHAWRKDIKHPTPDEDVKKMTQYLRREAYTVRRLTAAELRDKMRKVVEHEPDGSPLKILLINLMAYENRSMACEKTLEQLANLPVETISTG